MLIYAHNNGGLNYQSKLNYPDSLSGHEDAVRCIEYLKGDDYSIAKLDRLNWMSDKVVRKKNTIVFHGVFKFQKESHPFLSRETDSILWHWFAFDM